MIHPCTTVRSVSEQIGIGVFATDFIPRGTIIVVRDAYDLCLTRQEFQELPPLMRRNMETYMYHDHQGNLIMSWDHARYMNHSCNSNTLMTDYNLEIAVQDIQPGEEITTDYGLLNVQEPYALLCGCRNCRTRLRTDDLERFADSWDQSILDSLLQLNQVLQPLESILSPTERKRLEELQQKPQRYSSVRNLQWPRPEP